MKYLLNRFKYIYFRLRGRQIMNRYMCAVEEICEDFNFNLAEKICPLLRNKREIGTVFARKARGYKA